MVAIIKIGSSIRRTFHYNENKVNEGVAQLIMVGNYPIEMQDMNASQRLNMLLRTVESNPNVRSNSVHISLNFASGERLENEKLKAIARDYMQAIGFGDQPYLVYRHDDAGHPHIHIATVKVNIAGKRIETQNIGKTLSEPARKELELKYGLVKAEDHKRHFFSLNPVDAQKVQYGKSETKQAIANVLENVLLKYKYTSLPELNAVLNLYNVSAERGDEDSRIYKKRGLVYRVLDAEGKPVGVPVKASLFHNKPTLAYLENRFLSNDVARQSHKNKVKSLIDFVLTSKPLRSIESLDTALRNSGIRMVLRKNKEGLVYGITYVDLKTRCVFNGSALGKNYSAKAILDSLRLKPKEQTNELENTAKLSHNSPPASKIITESSVETIPNQPSSKHEKSLLDELLQYEYASQVVPFAWKKKRKKKKKR